MPSWLLLESPLVYNDAAGQHTVHCSTRSTLLHQQAPTGTERHGAAFTPFPASPSQGQRIRVDPARLRSFLSREITRAAAADAPLQALSTTLRTYQQLLDFQHLAQLAQAMAATAAATRQLHGRSPGRSPVASSPTVQALAKQLFGLARERLAGANQSAGAKPQGIMEMLEAFAALGLYDERLLSGMLASVEGQWGAFGAAQLGLMLHCMARLGCRPGAAWLQQYVAVTGET